MAAWREDLRRLQKVMMPSMRHESVTFTSYDGVRLGGYRVDPAAESEPLPNTRVLVLTGAGAAAEAYATALPCLADQLGSAYVFNLRGHGYGFTRSQGGDDGVLWQTASDIPPLVEHIAEDGNVILIGHSFSAVSVALAQCGWYKRDDAKSQRQPRKTEAWRQHLCISVLAGVPPLEWIGKPPSFAPVVSAILDEVRSRTCPGRWMSNVVGRIAQPYSSSLWERLIFELQHYGGFLPLPTLDVIGVSMLSGLMRSWYNVHSAGARELARQLTNGISWRVPVSALQRDVLEMLMLAFPRNIPAVYIWGEHEIEEGTARAYLEHSADCPDAWGIYVANTGHSDCLLNRATPVAYTLREIASHGSDDRLLKVD